jgi:hypothetical protein
MKRIFLLLIFVFCASFLHAQINESDTVRFQARFSVTGAWQKGNVEMFATRGKADISFSPARKLVFKTQNAYLYQSFFNKKADEDILSRNFMYWNPQARIYPFAMAFVSTNFRRNIDFRYFAGAGATWQIVHTKTHTLKFALSGVYEETNFKKTTFNDLAYNGQETIKTWRATAWLFGKHHVAKNKIILHYDAYLQPSLEKSNNLRWQVDAGVDLPITKNINFTTNFLYTYEGIVVLGNKQEDSILTFGVVFRV